MIILFNTFSDSVISRHRSLAGAVKANMKFQARVKAKNGKNSYIPVEYRQNDGSRVDPEALANTIDSIVFER